MRIGYMTNAWGATAGTGQGVTSIKDLQYQTVGLDDNAFREIAAAGFCFIEIFEGNLAAYAAQGPFADKLRGFGLELLAVYTGASFIYPDILPAELHRIEHSCRLASKAGAKYLTVGGGAVRHDGVRDDDFQRLAEALDRVSALAAGYGLTACYHPHLGTFVENAEQIDRLFALTGVSFCPDCGHIHAAGSDAVSLVERYLDRIVYLHLKDFANGDFAPIGTGEADIRRVLELVCGADHPIDCTVEAERVAGPGERARHARRYLDNVLKDCI